jgi:hypothetical protein
MKFGKRMGYAAAVVVAAMILAALAYGRWWSPRARARAAVERAAEAMSGRDALGVLNLVADDFGQGGLDKGRLAEALRMFFTEFDRVKVNLGEHKVSVSGDTAVDSIKAVVVVSKGGQQGYLLGQFGNPAGLAVKLKRRGRWLITGVDGMPGY